MLFAIKAYGYYFQGFHGVYEYYVDYFTSTGAADEMGRELSYELMDEYSEIFDTFSQDAESEGLEPNTEEFDNFIEECYTENVEYQIYKIKEELISEDMSTDDLKKLFRNNEEDFIKQYCEEV